MTCTAFPTGLAYMNKYVDMKSVKCDAIGHHEWHHYVLYISDPRIKKLLELHVSWNSGDKKVLFYTNEDSEETYLCCGKKNHRRRQI